MKKLFYLTLLLSFLAGCSGTLPVSHYKVEGPTGVLLEQANDQERQGHLDKAVALVERAVRIEPRNAFAWYKLARLNMALDNLAKAEQFARRSIQFAAGHRGLIRDNEQLLEAIRIKRTRDEGDSLHRR